MKIEIQLNSGRIMTLTGIDPFCEMVKRINDATIFQEVFAVEYHGKIEVINFYYAESVSLQNE